jgi:choline dehydrogenase
MHDYLIVGAGSAGCALAARLTEDPTVSVVLVEAGPPDSEEALHIPAVFAKPYRTPFDWDYLSGPEPGLPSAGVRSTCRAAACWAAPRRSTR